MKVTALALALAAAALGGSGLFGRAPRPVEGPPVVTVPAEPYLWRPSGDWRKEGRPASPPLIVRRPQAPLDIMERQVTRDDWAACVADGACDDLGTGAGPLPQTGMNWHDATAYARWLSRRTGVLWRLPTDEEWQRAAAERFRDDAVPAGDTGARMLADYERNTAGRETDLPLRASDGFGRNSHGLLDLAGNVWEWTDTCRITGRIEAGGSLTIEGEHCGIRLAAGQHRAPLPDFVRDARGGGCGLGLPPDHLGLRLVRDATQG
ncbi:formylglycine-generating enzyme family protein [Wenxinia marina]|uniref:Sulfatase-modifying factor enzyme-like domain-containing protein n=1 Tax=Wenxinia marina DSM 24838 TaxID=1123501 RepID=A0A0D0QGV9_9RHOB|nr:SUMF1/EgtB/PvdO family nonheme iron enzyme [Wenxinia marina]KIQ70228.1 hypothetical protein Wenmar_01187 [Wenxinia marina DSM 24838]